MRLPLLSTCLLLALVGCRYTEEDYVSDWIDLYCKEMIEKCDDGEDFSCGSSPTECCHQVFEEDAEGDIVGAYLGECPEFDGKQAKACLEAWEEIVDSNECLDNGGDEDITDPPECEDVCIPGLG